MIAAPPPPKKAKTRASSHSHTARFFLDYFPKEILHDVLKFFSRLPYAEDWVPHIPLESIIELYGVSGQLGEFMIPRFNTLCISNTFKNNSESSILHWSGKKGPMLWTADLDVAHRFVLAGGGQSLHTIIIGIEIYTEDLGTEIADDFRSRCPNVKSLSIENKGEVWVSRFGIQLEHLNIMTESSAVVSKSCSHLRELNLYLEGFEDDYENGEVDIWKQLGGNLECLTLCCTYPVVEHVRNIKMHCRNLQRIYIYDSEKYNQQISGLLASYGDQLEYCHTKWMNENQLTTISKACKNARFSAIASKNLIYTTLKVLGHQLEKIDISYPYKNLLDPGELRKAWNACPNLREIAVGGCDIDHAKSITATPKGHVKMLTIAMFKEIEESAAKKLLDIFAEGIDGIERIHFHGTQLAVDAFHKLISKNKSSLREFGVTFMNGISIERMDAFLPLFLECPALEVVISPQISRHMLETLSRRGVVSYDNAKSPRYAQ